MIILWILVIVFGIMSVVFLLGKGSFLIAGYNTSNQQEKAKYDEKKLCRVMGIGTMVITLSLAIGIILEEKGVAVITIGTLGAVAFIMIGSNTLCKRKDIPINKALHQ